jgi:hypothetical protein
VASCTDWAPVGAERTRPSAATIRFLPYGRTSFSSCERMIAERGAVNAETDTNSLTDVYRQENLWRSASQEGTQTSSL